MAGYGQLGWDVGTVGRWVRLVAGIMITLVVLHEFFGGTHTHTLRTNLLTGAFFAAFVLGYLGLYLLVVERVKDGSPWIPTIISVLPAIYFAVVNAMMVPYELSFGYLIGMPYVNHPVTMAMLLYIGVSFPVQFFTRYGGCEVIAIQNLLSRKRCASYCVPLLPLDVAEKAIVNAVAKRRRERSRVTT